MKTFINFTIVALLMHAAVADIAKIQTVVIDDVNGLPVEGARVFGSFRMSNGMKIWTESPCPNVDEKITDADGRCSLQGKTNVGHAGCWVSKAPRGYYESNAAGSFDYSTKDLFGVWQPDNLVATIRLQRVEHPIPLLVKYVRLADSKNGLGGESWTNCTFRYDLLKGDWLPPYGHGETADIQISSELKITDKERKFRHATKKVEDVLFYELVNRIKVGGKDDYISAFEADRKAGIKIRKAEDKECANEITKVMGVRKKIAKNKNWHCEYFSDTSQDRCYTFRIRSKRNDKGELVEAYYGKIYGDFVLEGDDMKGLKSIEFLYYLNPTSLDRNLEWDMKTNLCPGKRQSVQKRP